MDFSQKLAELKIPFTGYQLPAGIVVILML